MQGGRGNTGQAAETAAGTVTGHVHDPTGGEQLSLPRTFLTGRSTVRSRSSGTLLENSTSVFLAYGKLVEPIR